jgi:hypothetical protein
MIMKQTAKNKNPMKKISALIIAACSTGLAAHAQIINTFNSSDPMTGYTDTTILDNSSGAGSGVSFSDASGGLVASFSGTLSDPEQALFLIPTALPVGDALVVDTSIPATSTTEDLGIAISSTATPPAASSGNSYSSRTSFDYATISVRPSQTSIRQNTSSGGTLVSANDVISVAPTSVAQLFIENNGGGSFTFGYIDTSSVVHVDDTFAFSGSSTVGDAIGIYGDIRTAGTSLGSLNDLTIESISSVPEPTSLALFGIGLAGMGVYVRRKAK